MVGSLAAESKQSFSVNLRSVMAGNMRFSRSIKSSAQSLPSPDGAFIATLFASKLNIRETRSLETTRVISLPPELATSVSWFTWSKSSTRILLASPENIRVFSVDSQFSANITYPTSGTTRAVFVTFGSTKDEICVFAEFGLKLSIINLRSSKSVDINAPKFYSSGTAGKGFAYRPVTKNLALLTRHGGKDVISLHAKETYEVTRSWCPDTVDAQGLTWSIDGRWLVIWESSAQGHRALAYTADGHLFKIWNGPSQDLEGGIDPSLGAGIKLFDWAKTGTNVAFGDHSPRVTVLTAPTFTEIVSLLHSAAVTPSQTLQIWEERVTPSPNGGFDRDFVQASQAVYLPTLEVTQSTAETKTGTNILSFDHSGTLLATRTESMPTVLWIWDIAARILRAVMIFHSPIAKVTWHSSIDEVLLVRCEGDECRSLVHLWDPSWENPRIIDFAQQLIGGKAIGKTIARWLNVESVHPAIYFSDSQDCILASLVHSSPDGNQDVALPWMDAVVREFDIYGQQEESPLNLVPAKERFSQVTLDEMDESSTRMSGGSEDVDDTFKFRKFIEPAKNTRDRWT